MDHRTTFRFTQIVIFLLHIILAICETTDDQPEFINGVEGVGSDIDDRPGLRDYLRHLQETLSSDGEDEAANIVKRLDPTAFSFTRGKKDIPHSEILRSPARRLSPSGFLGMRGRRGPQLGFMGSRGKRYVDLSANEGRPKRQPPHGFVVARGKRVSAYTDDDSMPPGNYYELRDKKQPLSMGFFGARGKRALPKGFLGVRGKKAIPTGFLGARGKKSERYEDVERNDDSVLNDELRDIVEHWISSLNSQNKRDFSMRFYPLRG